MPSPPARAVVLLLGTLAATGAACGGEDENLPHPIDAAVDAPVDTPIDGNAFCSTCAANEICVQFFGGTCGELSLQCMPRSLACVGNTCTAECMQWHCNHGDPNPFFRCDKGVCPGAAPGALVCQGP